MRKRLINCTAFIILLICGSPAFAQSLQISTGLAWLYSAQTPTGNWPEVVTTDYYSTAASLDSISALDPSNSAYTTGFQWLSSQVVSPTDYLARRIIALKRSGVDATAEIEMLVLLRDQYGRWGGESEYSYNTLDTALALNALHAAGYADYSVLFQAMNFLTTNQNTDGSWKFGTDGSSNTYLTAIILKTLALYNNVTFNVQSSIDKAVAYLLAKQNTDGGFGSSPSNVYETALSIISLIESGQGGQGSALPLQNAITYLTTTQLADGSWNDDPYSTALALQALASARPNLSILSISLSKPMPQENESITITATVHNTGFDSASSIVVRFFLGDPNAGGIQIGVDQVIPTLVVGGSAQTSISASFTGTGGKTIFVIADPDNTISETSESDNKASARLWVATGPDLAVFSEDLKPSTYVPASGTPFTLEYTIRNLGESSTGGFDVALYEGQPAGTPLQTINISGLNGTETRTGTVGVTLTGDGAHTLYFVADPADQITEMSEANNTGTVTVQVGGVQQYADITVGSMQITPSRPHTNETVQITASVRNQGLEDASFFTVEIFDGVPESGGTLIHTQTISLAPGAEQIITTNFTITSGIHDIYVVLDRMNGIIESDENNNRASGRVMTDMVDISISATDLSFNPVHPVSGDSVVLSITVHNQGIRETGPFNLALYDGDPNNSGILLQTYVVGSMQGDSKTTISYIFTAQPWTYRFYAVADTENAVAELYEDNNLAVRSLVIKGPGETYGPDLVPTKIDLSSLTTDPLTLSVGGTAKVTFQNKGDDSNKPPFDVIIFEDKDNNNAYTPEIDKKLDEGKYVMGRMDSEELPNIAIVVHDCDHPSYLGERVYLLEHDGKIAWGPVYLNELDPEASFTSHDSIPIISDFDGDGAQEIVIRVNDKYVILNREGYLKQTLPSAGGE